MTEVDIASYLDLEDSDRDSVSLTFVCKAACSDRTYWIWTYVDDGGDSCQVVVTQFHVRERDDLYEIGAGSFGKDFSSNEDLVDELLRAGV